MKKLHISITDYFLACPKCNHVVKFGKLSGSKLHCQKCGNISKTPHIFPDFSSLKLLEMIEYFYERTCHRSNDLKTKLLDIIKKELGKKYHTNLVIKTVRKIQKIYKTGKRSEYNEMLKIIRKELSLKSSDEALKVFGPLLSYTDTFEEHKVIVILTCTLLEVLFNNLLVLIYECKGMTLSQAEKKVYKLQGFDKMCEVFEIETGLIFKNEINKYSSHDFYKDWEFIRKKRNKFIHGIPYAINRSIATKALNLAKEASNVFAHLQNKVLY